MIKYLIGIDGGGTKTEICAITIDGLIIDEVITGPGSAAVTTEKIVWNDIAKGIDELLSKIDSLKYQLIYIGMGLSAYSILESIDDVKKKFQEKYKVSVDINSDTVIALHSVLQDKYDNGIVVVSGTGVAIYGQNGPSTALIGGWGHIIRELGSSYAAVHHFGLRIIDNMEDNMPLTSLETSFLNLLHEHNIKDLKHLFYFHSKTEIASFVVFLKDEATKGNEEAKDLLKQEGAYLAIQVLKAIKKLNLSTNYVIGLRGGFVQKNSRDVIEGFSKVLRDNNICAPIITDDTQPIMGCY